MSLLSVIPYILIAMVFYGFGEYYSKLFANTLCYKFAIFAWIGYAINAFFFFPAIAKFNSLSVLGTFWNILYVILTLFMGVVIFHEPLTTLQIIGVIFGFISIILLSV